MLNIKIYPREIALMIRDGKILIPNSYVMISIFSDPQSIVYPDPQVKSLPKKCKDWLSLCFTDITEKDFKQLELANYKQYYKLFDETHAIQIINFVNIWKDKVSEFIIHCDAGISRSGSCGLWIARYLNLNIDQFYKDNPNIFPNPWVLQLLTKLSKSGINEETTMFKEI